MIAHSRGGDVFLYVLIRILILASLIVIVRWLVRILARESGIVLRFCVALGLSTLCGLALMLVGTPLPIAGASTAAILAISLWGSSRSPTGARTPWLDMRFDKNGVPVSGTVLQGAFAGAELDDLDEAALRDLMAEISIDAESQRLLYEYCARRFGGQRLISLDQEREARNRGASQQTNNPTSQMSRAQALEILGLQEGARVSEIEEACDRILSAVRSENGGSAYLESQIKAAKAILLPE